MGIIVNALATVYVALAVWLVVRIVNRREKWAKLTTAALIAVPLFYVLSFGPACWIVSRTSKQNLPAAYRPFIPALGYLEEWRISGLLRWYAGVGMSSTGIVVFPTYGKPESDDRARRNGICIFNDPTETGVLGIFFVDDGGSPHRGRFPNPSHGWQPDSD